jgi:hypothetical protein
MVLRLCEDVEAEDGLEQRRVPDRERRLLLLGEVEANGDARPYRFSV